MGAAQSRSLSAAHISACLADPSLEVQQTAARHAEALFSSRALAIPSVTSAAPRDVLGPDIQTVDALDLLARRLVTVAAGRHVSVPVDNASSAQPRNPIPHSASAPGPAAGSRAVRAPSALAAQRSLTLSSSQRIVSDADAISGGTAEAMDREPQRSPETTGISAAPVAASSGLDARRNFGAQSRPRTSRALPSRVLLLAPSLAALSALAALARMLRAAADRGLLPADRAREWGSVLRRRAVPLLTARTLDVDMRVAAAARNALLACCAAPAIVGNVGVAGISQMTGSMVAVAGSDGGVRNEGEGSEHVGQECVEEKDVADGVGVGGIESAIDVGEYITSRSTRVGVPGAVEGRGPGSAWAPTVRAVLALRGAPAHQEDERVAAVLEALSTLIHCIVFQAVERRERREARGAQGGAGDDADEDAADIDDQTELWLTEIDRDEVGLQERGENPVLGFSRNMENVAFRRTMMLHSTSGQRPSGREWGSSVALSAPSQRDRFGSLARSQGAHSRWGWHADRHPRSTSMHASNVPSDSDLFSGRKKKMRVLSLHSSTVRGNRGVIRRSGGSLLFPDGGIGSRIPQDIQRGESPTGSEQRSIILRRDMRAAMSCFISLFQAPFLSSDSRSVVATELVRIMLNAKSGHRARAAHIDAGIYREIAVSAFVDYAPAVYGACLKSLFRIMPEGTVLPNADCSPRTASACVTLLRELIAEAPRVCVPRGKLLVGLTARLRWLAEEAIRNSQAESALASIVETGRVLQVACGGVSHSVHFEQIVECCLRNVYAASSHLMSASCAQLETPGLVNAAIVEIVQSWKTLNSITPPGLLWMHGPSYFGTIMLLASMARRVGVLTHGRARLLNEPNGPSSRQASDAMQNGQYEPQQVTRSRKPEKGVRAEQLSRSARASRSGIVSGTSAGLQKPGKPEREAAVLDTFDDVISVDDAASDADDRNLGSSEVRRTDRVSVLSETSHEALALHDGSTVRFAYHQPREAKDAELLRGITVFGAPLWKSNSVAESEKNGVLKDLFAELLLVISAQCERKVVIHDVLRLVLYAVAFEYRSLQTTGTVKPPTWSTVSTGNAGNGNLTRSATSGPDTSASASAIPRSPTMDTSRVPESVSSGVHFDVDEQDGALQGSRIADGGFDINPAKSVAGILDRVMRLDPRASLISNSPQRREEALEEAKHICRSEWSVVWGWLDNFNGKSIGQSTDEYVGCARAKLQPDTLGEGLEETLAVLWTALVEIASQGSDKELGEGRDLIVYAVRELRTRAPERVVQIVNVSLQMALGTDASRVLSTVQRQEAAKAAKPASVIAGEIGSVRGFVLTPLKESTSKAEVSDPASMTHGTLASASSPPAAPARSAPGPFVHASDGDVQRGSAACVPSSRPVPVVSEGMPGIHDSSASDAQSLAVMDTTAVCNEISYLRSEVEAMRKVMASSVSRIPQAAAKPRRGERPRLSWHMGWRKVTNESVPPAQPHSTGQVLFRRKSRGPSTGMMEDDGSGVGSSVAS